MYSQDQWSITIDYVLKTGSICGLYLVEKQTHNTFIMPVDEC